MNIQESMLHRFKHCQTSEIVQTSGLIPDLCVITPGEFALLSYLLAAIYFDVAGVNKCEGPKTNKAPEGTATTTRRDSVRQSTITLCKM